MYLVCLSIPSVGLSPLMVKVQMLFHALLNCGLKVRTSPAHGITLVGIDGLLPIFIDSAITR